MKYDAEETKIIDIEEIKNNMRSTVKTMFEGTYKGLSDVYALNQNMLLKIVSESVIDMYYFILKQLIAEVVKEKTL